MKHKPWICLPVCVALLLAMLTGCGESGEDPSEELAAQTQIEIQAAIDLGLMPEELRQDYQKTIQYDEFCALLTNVISLRYGEGPWLDAWLENVAAAIDCTESMTRGGGAEVIFVGALSVGMDDYHSGAYLQEDIDGATQGAALEGAPRRADLLPILDAPYENPVWGETYETGFQGAERYVWHRASAISHKTLMEYDPDTLSMRYDEPFSRGEAIASALRCYESWVERDYVTTDDPRANTYDANIITADLLEKESALPEVSHDTLPAQWRGLSTYSKGNSDAAILDSFRQRDFSFLSENGMNFARVLLSFTTLRYPDYPEDGGQVNVAELENLDQLVAWALEYDIHLSLCMLSPPGYAQGEDGNAQSVGEDIWPDAERWKLIGDYWTMLARRYVEIPAKNLSFELCAEWGAQDSALIEDFTRQWGTIVEEIRAISPDRVLIASFDTARADKLPLAEAMAAMGVSLAAHPYYPAELWYFSTEQREEMGYVQEAQWPMVWFPTADFDMHQQPITITGELGGIDLTIYARSGEEIAADPSGEPTLTVSAAGAVLGSYTFSTGGAKDGFTISIPEGAETVTLTHTGNFQLYCLSAEGPFGTSQVATVDGCNSATPGTASLVLSGDGVWSDARGRVYDAQSIYTYGLAPYLELAERYGVGFMVNELTFFDAEQDTGESVPLEAYLNCYGDCIDLFEDKGIGYSLTFLAHSNIGLIGDERGEFAMWSDYPEDLRRDTCTYSSGLSETYSVNGVLLDLILDHMTGKG